MNVQIFGRKDCSETRKAERWFRERRISVHFVDLKQKGLAPRELESVAKPIGLENLLDRQSKRFLEKGLAFMSPARISRVLLEDPLLLRTPIVRNGKEATLGMRPEIWMDWK
jgi:arsenate reductase-like glutaredoxin family protein